MPAVTSPTPRLLDLLDFAQAQTKSTMSPVPFLAKMSHSSMADIHPPRVITQGSGRSFQCGVFVNRPNNEFTCVRAFNKMAIPCGLGSATRHTPHTDMTELCVDAPTKGGPAHGCAQLLPISDLLTSTLHAPCFMLHAPSCHKPRQFTLTAHRRPSSGGMADRICASERPWLGSVSALETLNVSCGSSSPDRQAC